jgi:hypothetical protein
MFSKKAVLTNIYSIMKKNIFLAICLLVAGSVSAQRYYPGPPRGYMQDNGSNQVTVSIEGGVSLANTIVGNDYYYGSTSGIAGGHVGLSLDIPVAYGFSFSPGAMFSQKGFQASTDYGDFTQRTNYIDVPLLAKFKVVRGLNFFFGPELTFLLSTHNTFDNGFDVTHEDIYNGNQNSSYVAGLVGFSIDLNRYVDVYARYAIDFDTNTAQGSVQTPDYRNQVYQFGLGLKFR